jgi:hypothetical protein
MSDASVQFRQTMLLVFVVGLVVMAGSVWAVIDGDNGGFIGIVGGAAIAVQSGRYWYLCAKEDIERERRGRS